MDSLKNILFFPINIIAPVIAIAGLFVIALSIYWLFNRKAKKVQLAALRKQLDEMQPTDPQYNQVRTLYIATMIEAQRWDFFHGADTDAGTYSAGEYSDGGGDGD